MTEATPPEPAMREPARQERTAPHPIRDMLMALRFYSRLPTGNSPHERPSLSLIAPVAPFASVVIGALPAVLLPILFEAGMPRLYAATLAVAAMAIATGAMAEDALADACDGLFGGHTPEDRLKIMKDSRHGTYGVAAIVLMFMLRVISLASFQWPAHAAMLWLAATVTARSGSLLLPFMLPPARSSGLAAAAGRPSGLAIGLGLVFAVALSSALSGFAVGWQGLGAAYVVCAIVIGGWTVLCRNLVGGQSGDLIGGLQALLEIAVLSAFISYR